MDATRPGETPSADAVPVTFASMASVVDCGDMIWCLLVVKPPAGAEPAEGEEKHATPARWVVFPRSGFMVSLFAAMEQFVPDFEGGLAPTPLKPARSVN